MILPFGIPWKYVIIGLVALAITVGVKSAVGAYNDAIAEAEEQRQLKERERTEKEKAIHIAQINADRAKKLGSEILRLNNLISNNRETRQQIEENLNGEVAAWKRRALDLARNGDKCIDAQHPDNLFDDGVREGERTRSRTPSRGTAFVPAKFSDGTRICTGLYGACLVRLGNIFETTARSNSEAKRR